jgi:zinc and cadmium transporter
MFGIGSSADFVVWYKRIMAVVIGIFLHISTTILFESGAGHRFNLYKMAAIITGGLAGLLAM